MDDVLRPEAAFRRDRLDDRDRPLDGQLVAIAPRAPSPPPARAAARRRVSRRSRRRPRAAASARGRASRGE